MQCLLYGHSQGALWRTPMGFLVISLTGNIPMQGLWYLYGPSGNMLPGRASLSLNPVLLVTGSPMSDEDSNDMV